MVTTGMSIFGKMSVGVRTIARPPKIKIRIASTTSVYGRFSASFTIHRSHPKSFHRISGLNNLTKLLPVPRGPSIQSRNKLLGRWGHGDLSRQNNVPRRNLPAVHAAIVAVVRPDCGAFERDAGEQAARPRVAQDFGTQGGVRFGRRIAADRACGRGSVPSQLDLAGENAPRATFIHDEQDKIRSLSAYLKTKAAALKSHHRGSAPGSSEVFALAARHSAPPIASTNDECGF